MNLSRPTPLPLATSTASPAGAVAPLDAGPNALHWPVPHHMRLVCEDLDSKPERGIATLSDGEKIVGEVSRIDFEAGTLDIASSLGSSRHVLFETLRSLYLCRNVELEAIPMAVPPGALEARASTTRRQCVVTFKDASTVQYALMSIVIRKEGLFLFVIDSADEIVRCFVPTAAFSSYNVGDRVGQTLHDQYAVSTEALQEGLQIQHELRDRKIGAYFADQDLVTREQLEMALARQRTMAHIKLGDVLVQEGIISMVQRDAALAKQGRDRSKPIGAILVEMGVVTREVVRKVLVEQLGFPCVNLSRFQYDPNAIKAVSAELARKHHVMPMYRTDGRIVVSMEDPLSLQALHEIEFFTGLKVDPVIAEHEDLLSAIAQFYGADADNGHIGEIIAELGVEDKFTERAQAEVVTESDNTLVRLVNKMITDAFDQGASDIHIESRIGKKPSRVRFRIDGVLSSYIDVPPNFRAALVSRLKIMSSLDISEHRRPQDGRIRFRDFGPRRIELRVVIMPTAGGMEDVVMRILSAPRTLSLEQLGFSPRVLADFKSMALRSFGLIFVCGPTGSGKTTTLHSLLNHINTAERKIWTVEDPIEISQDGLCQVQVNEKLGLSFPSVLRSFLRADPDVIMVGETRDPETAHTVIAASLTGHLVLSTMHTNSAVESIIRLLDFGLDPFNFSDALIGILGQRLVRRLCPSCSQPYQASPQDLEGLAREYCHDLDLDPVAIVASWRSLYGDKEGAITLHAPVGCPMCELSGYKGRLGVYELLVASASIKAMIQARVNSTKILQEAVATGMVTFEQHAIEKVLRGELDLKQVLVSCR